MNADPYYEPFYDPLSFGIAVIGRIGLFDGGLPLPAAEGGLALPVPDKALSIYYCIFSTYLALILAGAIEELYAPVGSSTGTFSECPGILYEGSNGLLTLDW